MILEDHLKEKMSSSSSERDKSTPRGADLSNFGEKIAQEEADEALADLYKDLEDNA